ncbi:MAG TPA: hypothetical protein VHM23_20395 [Actinomycetota bacterium]|jgi:hypothetical protein|nr:hypothetical protein [Actinomycetota bacterium]
MGGWRRAGVVVVGLVVAAGFGSVRGSEGRQEPEARTRNTEIVGHVAPEQDGGYGDVWAHRDVAYLGSLRQGDCQPPNGVWSIDLSDPAKPRPLASFARFPGSDGEDVWVGAVRTRAFKGDLAVVGIQPCTRQGQGFAGMALFDVTNPARPKELGRWATGLPIGVHELGVVQRPDGRLLALAAANYSFNLSQGRHGDLRIIDITDPRRPRELADWDVRRDGPADARGQLAARRDVFAHSAWPFDKGNKAYVSFWSAGVQFLDISDPTAPRLIGQTPYRPEDGYRGAHSGWFNEDETLFVQNDEAMRTVGSGSRASWTFQRVFDTSSLARPRLLSTFATESAVPGQDGRVATDGIYSVHNAVIEGDLEYVSWYSDGVRVVDLSDPGRPREVASFVPPPSPPRQIAATAQNGRRDMPVVWGVYPWKDLVLASDMNSGLWVIRVTADAAGSSQGGSGAGGSGQAAPSRGAAPEPDPPLGPAADPGGPGVATWVGLAGLALGLLAVGAVVRSAARRRQSG